MKPKITILIDRMPKSCNECPFCEWFDKDAHGKGKHEVACCLMGTCGNILYGDQLSPKKCNALMLKKNYVQSYVYAVLDEAETEFTKYLPLKDKTGAGYYASLNKIREKFINADFTRE